MPRTLRTCPHCGLDFTPAVRPGPVPRFCGKACQERANERVKVERKRAKRIRDRAALACQFCGASLAARRATKFCSVQCADRDSDRHHRRRTRERSARTGEVISFAQIAERDGWKCSLCGDPVDRSIRGPAAGAASLDHVVPLSKGGAHAPSNLRLAHLGCNRLKGARLPMAEGVAA